VASAVNPSPGRAKGAGLLADDEGPRATPWPWPARPIGEAATAWLLTPSALKTEAAERRRDDAGDHDNHRGERRMPPIFSLMPIATGVVHRLGGKRGDGRL